METVHGDFDLTMDELRDVAEYALLSAEQVLPRYEAVTDDQRPRLAVEAARLFVEGDRRRRLQRVTSLDAHRAATAASSEIAKLAATAAGDAAAAAYLHPLAKANQVGHILRAAACEVRIAELEETPGAPESVLATCVARASGSVRSVLSRYPSPTPGRSPLSRVVAELDERLRATSEAG